MAVKPPSAPQQVRSFWPRFRTRSIFLVICMQIIATLVVSCALLIFHLGDPTNPYFWVTILAFAVASLGVNVLLFTQLADPLKELSNALTHSAGEPTDTTPPSPNAKRFEQNGLKPLLQRIYELGTRDETSPSDKRLTKKAELVLGGLDTSTTGFVILNNQRQIIYANAAAPVITTSTGDRSLELVFDDSYDINSWLDDSDDSVRSTHQWTRIPNKIPGEDERKLYDISASYEKGSTAEAVITFFDRTEEYQPEDEDLDFIAFAAHELRGPVTVIRGYLDVISDELAGKMDDEQKELVSRLVVSANRLSSYINNILNASRYDRRHLKIHLQEDKLSAVYATIADDMQLRAGSQGRILSIDIPENLPSVAADRASLSEVFGNLIDNAIKYSNEGGVVRVTAQQDGDFVEVTVEDHGIGMPGNVVSNLFHKFYRSHRSRETVAGTGIGLYISKAIVESHGGSMRVRSTEGQGSTFSFTVPTYASVADKLTHANNSNEGLISQGSGWIKNHNMFRG